MLSKSEKLARLKLIRSEKIGPKTFWKLINIYGSAEHAIKSFSNAKKICGINLGELVSDEKITAEINFLKEIQARLIFFEDMLYPPLLRHIFDAPPILTFIGKKEKLQEFYNRDLISVVGARNASLHAKSFTKDLCRDLGNRGVVIVSGFAIGVDSEAHNVSLENGTIAILPGGINTIYPPENEKLYYEIIKKGAIFSEMPYNAHISSSSFPKRNRIIAGLSKGVIVIEASQQSGSLITAKFALEYGRDVFAVPGFPGDPRSSGGNSLLKQGAILVQDYQDVIDHLVEQRALPLQLNEGKVFYNNSPISKSELKEIKRKILENLNYVPITIDELISSIKVSPREVLVALMELELENQVKRHHGQTICLVLDNKLER